MKKTIWVDITNVPHVNFLFPLIEHYKNNFNFIFSLRDFAETKALFEQKISAPYIEIGVHKGNNKLSKFLARLSRNYKLNKVIPHFDCSISVGGSALIIAKFRGKPSITFDDNEKSPNWLYAPFSNLAFWPKVVERSILKKQLFSDKAIYQYNGYKEDFYIADYIPDSSFKSSIPFNDYVVVRAENIKASYVKGKKSIVPDLLKKLCEQKQNIVFLPRYKSDIDYAKGVDGIYIPQTAINGLDACYFAKAILTGAGTMAREAACLGIPAVSFYAGSDLLSVDISLVKAGKMYFSRNVDDIINFLSNIKKVESDTNRSKAVQNEIFNRLDSFFIQHNLI